ncbi:MAG: Rieske 2Fe-2S domain-containing protein [Acidimicrobiaceae bacterium]|nr:Rieske 2Fe-2S domain-containing protein [Acidimicrobiaceae bacterium]MXW61706.1 Rieske 2Fe-2S domain-containing protein [Acidimicrobiaceae bacterium]MXW75676.1 Rieske 2Fe-2S domain-containing protein [Acidimicrobiaceae bacterium]MYA75823.1 Rieske 2Fe-2S domain-containing protein [Acidimicrobiaceae bacterium]MYC42270.1 Rieske 2Fe-2S domain-containing protein [Acidimicrobiaceae bacterium]
MRIAFRRHASNGRESQFFDDLRLASYPHPYPDGWYRLCDSKSLRRGQARYLECLGRALVIWRGQDSGEVFAMQAFCPHLGANLSHGRVCEDRIECPFHAWQFTGDGRAARVPYTNTVPKRVTAESFPVEEVHGQIFMFHCGTATRQQAGEKVPYPVPRVSEIDDGSFVFRGHYDAGCVHTHVIELLENAADYAHFGRLHGRMDVPRTQFPIPGVELEHTVRLGLDDDREAHKLPLHVQTALKVFGRRIERSRANAVVTFTGAGSIANFRITIPDVGEVEIIQTQLPIAPFRQQVDFRWFADRKVPRLVVRYVVENWISQWRKDRAVWQAKIFRESPTLCQDDGPVMPLRRWYSQFFPDSTPRADRREIDAASG